MPALLPSFTLQADVGDERLVFERTAIGMSYRTLAPGQRAQIWIGGPGVSEPELLLETGDVLVEAPNWSLDGDALYVNGHGVLWRLDVGSPDRMLTRVDYDDLPDINNDHVLDPDGEHIFLSAQDGHIYRGALTGGLVQRVSPDDGHWHYLHGVSPDGSRLAYVQIGHFGEPGRLALLELGGHVVIVDTGPGHLDGPEWSPDGAWIYFNTESFTQTPGHAQLARIPDPGGPMERMVASDTVDWFPHLSPNAATASYIAFPTGTLGHPADLDVEVRVVAVSDWSVPLQRYRVFGGQGTLNVNSWSPDSTRFAFVAYPRG
jgi:TolB protein